MLPLFSVEIEAGVFHRLADGLFIGLRFVVGDDGLPRLMGSLGGEHARLPLQSGFQARGAVGAGRRLHPPGECADGGAHRI